MSVEINSWLAETSLNKIRKVDLITALHSIHAQQNSRNNIQDVEAHCKNFSNLSQV